MSDAPPVAALIFDLGNVLLPFDHGRMTTQTAKLLGIDAAQLDAFWFGEDQLFWRMENGEFDSRELHRLLSDRFAPSDYDAFAAAASDIFNPDTAMADLVQSLDAGGYRLVLLSNTSDLHIDFIRRTYDTLQPFDALTLSYEVACSKPEPAIYEHAIAQTGHPAAACLFIDDRPENVAGAEAVGLRAHQFKDAATLRGWLREHGVAVA